MNIRNFEFKARVTDIAPYEQQLLTLHPIYKGLDHQIDTYFNATQGRLKLREGNIENALIHYSRENIAGSKQSQVILYQHQPNPALKQILTKELGIKVVVNKQRKIYFINNVKFHLDVVQQLGTFIEVEAIDNNNQFTIEALQQQCDYYFQFFNLEQHQVEAASYSDLLMAL